MKGTDLSRQLGDLPEDMIAEAMAPAKPMRRKNIAGRLLRITAAAAAVVILLTALSFWPTGTDPQVNGLVAVSGVMRVYACEPEESEGSSLEAYELTDTIDSYNRVWTPGVSGLITGFGIPLMFQLNPEYFGEAEISLHVSVDYGEFFIEGKSNEQGQKLILENGQTAVWKWKRWYEATEILEPWELFYAYVFVYADERLVGYGIIDFIFYPPAAEGLNPAFAAKNYSFFCFPMTEDDYPDLSEEDVWEQIKQYKRNKAR